MTLSVSIAHRFETFRLDLEFETHARGVTALFGPSGCGKTSAVNAVAGLLKPTRGRVCVNDRVLLDTARGIDVPPRKRRIGYVFQGARLFPHLSVRGNLLYGWRRARARLASGQVDHIIDVLGVRHLLDRRPASLSGGERQRVAIGRALLTAPELLLLDEPLSALDHKRRDDILPYLERLRDEEGIPMIYVSHSVDEVSRLADEVLIVDEGRVVASGPVSAIFSRIDLFPLTGRFEAGAVVATRIHSHMPEYALSRLTFPGGQLVVPEVSGAPGDAVRIRIRARDVVLAVTRPEGLSANNVLDVRIEALRADPGAFSDVALSCGPTRLVARVTRAAVTRLGLREGARGYAIVKSVAIDQRAGEPLRAAGPSSR